MDEQHNLIILEQDIGEISQFTRLGENSKNGESIDESSTNEQSLVHTPTSTSQNPAIVYLARLTTHNSRITMQRSLNTISDIISPQLKKSLPKSQNKTRFQYIKWELLRFQHTNAIKAQLAERYKPASTNTMLSALRGVLETAFDLELIDADTWQRASKVKNIKHVSLPVGRDISDDEVLQLLRNCQDDRNNNRAIRDMAILVLLWRCGLRRQELVNLDIADVDIAMRRLTIRSAKGNKDRTVFVAIKALPLFLQWYQLRGADEEQTSALFLPIRKDGTVIYERDKSGGKVKSSKDEDESDSKKPARLSSQAVYNMLQKRANEVDIADTSPHDFRRTLIGDLLDKNVDIVTVSKIVGHASPTVTSKYDRRPERTKRDALDTLDVPQLWLE